MIAAGHQNAWARDRARGNRPLAIGGPSKSGIGNRASRGTSWRDGQRGAYNGSFHLSEMRAKFPSRAGEKPWAPARPVQLHRLRSRGARLVWQIRLHALAGFRPEAPDKWA